MKRSHALGLLLITALLWSVGGLLIKSIAWPPLAIAGFRSAVASVFFLMICRPRSLRASRYQMGGAVAYAGTVILFVTATKMTTAANAILLQYTAPLYVALFGAWFLGERATRLDWFAIALAFFGMALFFGEKLSVQSLWGNIWAVVSGLSFAWLTLFLRKIRGPEGMGVALLGNVITASLCLPFVLQAGWPDIQSLVLLLILGTFQLGLSYYLYVKAIQYVTALEAMMIQFVEPILNPIWVFLFLGERPGQLAFVGGLIILTAIVIRNVYQRPRLAQAPS